VVRLDPRKCPSEYARKSGSLPFASGIFKSMLEDFSKEKLFGE